MAQILASASLLVSLLIGSFGQGIPDTKCCFKKEVGGIRYVLVAEEDTSALGCNANCIYAQDSDPESRYCFKAGVLPVSCVNQEAPERTEVSIGEEGEELVQENEYHEDEGILTVKVPPHKNYTESVFFLHEDSKTSMLKTGGMCAITDLPDHLNVASMAEGFQTHNKMRAEESNTETSYLIKSREARYGAQKRAAELHPEAAHLCKDDSVVKTNDVYVPEEDFKKFENGEVIIIGDGKNTRQAGNCELKSSVARAGRGACGYGWRNPAGGGISLHEVSQAGFTVTCAIPTENNKDKDKDDVYCDGYELPFCQCKIIKTKADLTTCLFKGNKAIDSEITVDERRTNLIQTMSYNAREEGDYVLINSPAYGGYEATDVMMHAHKDGWWHEGVYSGTLKNNKMLKIGGVCHIATLPYDTLPVDIAIGIQEIKEGNDVTTGDDEDTQHEILIPDGVFTSAENKDLHADIKEMCKDSSIKKFVLATPGQTEVLKNGGVIVLDDGEDLGNAAMLGQQGSGSWRFPNNGAKLWINRIVSPVKTAACCVSEECKAFGGLCDCNQIDGKNFDECYSSARVAKQLKMF